MTLAAYSILPKSILSTSTKSPLQADNSTFFWRGHGQKYNSGFINTRHFKRKILLFWEGPSPQPSFLDPPLHGPQNSSQIYATSHTIGTISSTVYKRHHVQACRLLSAYKEQHVTWLSSRSTRTEVHAGRVACCPLVSHDEYARRALLTLEKNGTDGQVDGRQTVTLCLPLDATIIIRHHILS